MRRTLILCVLLTGCSIRHASVEIAPSKPLRVVRLAEVENKFAALPVAHEWEIKSGKHTWRSTIKPWSHGGFYYFTDSESRDQISIGGKSVSVRQIELKVDEHGNRVTWEQYAENNGLKWQWDI